MPTYLYRRQSDGQELEVKHSMKEEPQTWGELCHLVGLELAGISAEEPVKRLISGGSGAYVSGGAALPAMPSSGGGSCCGVSGCHD